VRFQTGQVQTSASIAMLAWAVRHKSKMRGAALTEAEIRELANLNGTRNSGQVFEALVQAIIPVARTTVRFPNRQPDRLKGTRRVASTAAETLEQINLSRTRSSDQVFAVLVPATIPATRTAVRFPNRQPDRPKETRRASADLFRRLSNLHQISLRGPAGGHLLRLAAPPNRRLAPGISADNAKANLVPIIPNLLLNRRGNIRTTHAEIREGLVIAGRLSTCSSLS
jgi:hypothetical protein